MTRRTFLAALAAAVAALWRRPVAPPEPVQILPPRDPRAQLDLDALMRRRRPATVRLNGRTLAIRPLTGDGHRRWKRATAAWSQALAVPPHPHGIWVAALEAGIFRDCLPDVTDAELWALSETQAAALVRAIVRTRAA